MKLELVNASLTPQTSHIPTIRVTAHRDARLAPLVIELHMHIVDSYQAGDAYLARAHAYLDLGFVLGHLPA